MADPVLRVEVTDLTSGETRTEHVVAGDYLLLATDPCHVAGMQAYPTKGTHVITIKGHRSGC